MAQSDLFSSPKKSRLWGNGLMSCGRWVGRAFGVRDESVTHGSPWKAYTVGEPEPQSLDKAHPWQGLSVWSGHSETRGQRKGRGAPGDFQLPWELLLLPAQYFLGFLWQPLYHTLCQLGSFEAFLFPAARWPLIRTVSHPWHIPSSLQQTPSICWMQMWTTEDCGTATDECSAIQWAPVS